MSQCATTNQLRPVVLVFALLAATARFSDAQGGGVVSVPEGQYVNLFNDYQDANDGYLNNTTSSTIQGQDLFPESQHGTPLARWVFGIHVAVVDDVASWPSGNPDLVTKFAGSTELRWQRLKEEPATTRTLAYVGHLGRAEGNLPESEFTSRSVRWYRAYADMLGVHGQADVIRWTTSSIFLPLPLGGKLSGSEVISHGSLSLVGLRGSPVLDVAYRGPDREDNNEFYGYVNYAVGAHAEMGAYVTDSYVDANEVTGFKADLALAKGQTKASTPSGWDLGTRQLARSRNTGIRTYRGVWVSPVAASTSGALDSAVPVHKVVGVQVGTESSSMAEGTYGIYIGQLDPTRTSGAQLTNGVNYGIYGEIPKIEDASDGGVFKVSYGQYWRGNLPAGGGSYYGSSVFPAGASQDPAATYMTGYYFQPYGFDSNDRVIGYGALLSSMISGGGARYGVHAVVNPGPGGTTGVAIYGSTGWTATEPGASEHYAGFFDGKVKTLDDLTVVGDVAAVGMATGDLLVTGPANMNVTQNGRLVLPVYGDVGNLPSGPGKGSVALTENTWEYEDNWYFWVYDEDGKWRGVNLGEEYYPEK